MRAVVPLNNTTVAEGGNAKPFPDGFKILANVVPTNKDGHSIVERPYASTGENSVIPALAIRFRASDENPLGAGRNYFADVPLARELKSTGGGKFPDGTPAFFYFQFFRALGYDVDAPEGFQPPEDPDLLGRQVLLVLGVDKDNEGNDRNIVKFINPAEGIPVNAPIVKTNVAAAAAPGWKPAGAPGVAAAPAAAAWTPPPAAGAAAWTPPPAQAVAVVPPAAGWTPPQATAPAAWSPDAADVASAQVLSGAVAGQGF